MDTGLEQMHLTAHQKDRDHRKVNTVRKNGFEISKVSKSFITIGKMPA